MFQPQRTALRKKGESGRINQQVEPAAKQEVSADYYILK